MEIAILGPGCRSCATLEARTREALGALGVDATVSHVTDPGSIAAYGVLRTPGLVVDGRVLVAGRVPTTAQIAELVRTR